MTEIDKLADELAHIYYARLGNTKTFAQCLERAWGYINRVLAASGVS